MSEGGKEGRGEVEGGKVKVGEEHEEKDGKEHWNGREDV